MNMIPMPMINPQAMINMIVQQYPQFGPIWKQAQQMCNGKSPKDVEDIIKNTVKTQGLDLDEAWGSFAQMFGLNTNVKPF